MPEILPCVCTKPTAPNVMPAPLLRALFSPETSGFIHTAPHSALSFLQLSAVIRWASLWPNSGSKTAACSPAPSQCIPALRSHPAVPKQELMGRGWTGIFLLSAALLPLLQYHHKTEEEILLELKALCPRQHLNAGFVRLSSKRSKNALLIPLPLS